MFGGTSSVDQVARRKLQRSLSNVATLVYTEVPPGGVTAILIRHTLWAVSLQ